MRLHPLSRAIKGFRMAPMGLRNQLFNFSTSACYRQEGAATKEEAKTCEEEDVLFKSYSGGKGLITLNRPKQLNTLNMSMVCKIRETLKVWKDDKQFVLLKGAGPKAFCAGGDVVSIVKDECGEVGKAFFKEEYKLDALISCFPATVTSIISGIVMGGGVGISAFGKCRVASETSLFAMPETLIGFFPDVGVTYRLARLPNNLGRFLALTGYRLKGYDLVHAGIATHYCTTDLLPELEKSLLCDPFKTCCQHPQDYLRKFQDKSLEKGTPPFSLAEHLNAINEWFSACTVEDIIKKICEDKSKFAEETLVTINKMSPLSLKVSFQQIRHAECMEIFDVFNMDYRIAVNMLKCSDFKEGVRALLIDKDKNPKWMHKHVSEVKDEEVNKFFTLEKSDDELNLPESLYC